MITFFSTLLADNLDLTPKGKFANLANTNITIPNIVQAGLSLILIVAALLFFFMLVLGGIRWILSGGDKGATEAARSQVTAALIGLVIVFAAWAIAMFVGQFFGVGIFTNFIVPTIGSPTS